MINIKTKEEVKVIREGGRILAEIVNQLKERVVPGIATEELNTLAEELISKNKVKPSFKNYKGFPKALCVSINEVIVHGIPSEYILKEGDIATLDLGVLHKGFHTDMAITVPVGSVSSDILRLIRETKKALKRGIKKIRPGNTIGDVENTIGRHIERSGFSIIEGLCGHGIGRSVHEEPQILNYGKRRSGPKIREGMVFCLEPMLSMGSKEIAPSGDGMGIKTADNSLSAQFEHTVAVTENGSIVVTEL